LGSCENGRTRLESLMHFTSISNARLLQQTSQSSGLGARRYGNPTDSGSLGGSVCAHVDTAFSVCRRRTPQRAVLSSSSMVPDSACLSSMFKSFAWKKCQDCTSANSKEITCNLALRVEAVEKLHQGIQQLGVWSATMFTYTMSSNPSPSAHFWHCVCSRDQDRSRTDRMMVMAVATSVSSHFMTRKRGRFLSLVRTK
jgi:hypothetical protein